MEGYGVGINVTAFRIDVTKFVLGIQAVPAKNHISRIQQRYWRSIFKSTVIRFKSVPLAAFWHFPSKAMVRYRILLKSRCGAQQNCFALKSLNCLITETTLATLYIGRKLGFSWIQWRFVPYQLVFKNVYPEKFNRPTSKYVSFDAHQNVHIRHQDRASKYACVQCGCL